MSSRVHYCLKVHTIVTSPHYSPHHHLISLSLHVLRAHYLSLHVLRAHYLSLHVLRPHYLSHCMYSDLTISLIACTQTSLSLSLHVLRLHYLSHCMYSDLTISPKMPSMSTEASTVMRMRCRILASCLGLAAISILVLRLYLLVTPTTMRRVNPDKLVIGVHSEIVIEAKFEEDPASKLTNQQVPSASSTRDPRIPYILHQTWITEHIPATYVPYVESWKAHRPPLTYYYWTDESSLRFVAKHYPQLLGTFKGYKAHLSRADAIRYMLLHHYGGVYADMDMMRLRDLSPLLNSTLELCYLSQERFEITRLFWGLDSSVMNAIMLSAPGHRFMEFVVNSLPRYAHHSPKVMESTGPLFLQNVFNEFQKSPPCNLSSAMCRCMAADPYVFMPLVDPIRIPLFRSKCSNPSQLTPNQLEACGMLDKVGWRNDLQSIGAMAFTHHGFLHYGFENQGLRFDSEADICSVRPDRLVFGRNFH